MFMKNVVFNKLVLVSLHIYLLVKALQTVVSSKVFHSILVTCTLSS